MDPSISEYSRRYSSLPESRFQRENAEFAHKLDNALKENMILTKQLEHYKRDHGELLLTTSEYQHRLADSTNECAHLRHMIAAAEQEKVEVAGKIRDLSCEVKLLKKQNEHLSDENAGLEARKTKMEEESEGLKREIMRLEKEKEEMGRREKELLEKLKVGEKDRTENSKLRLTNARLERELSSVMTAATDRYRTFEKRLSELERAVAILYDNAYDSGTQLVPVMQEQESFGVKAKCERLVGAQSGHETAPIEEKTASSMPSPKATSATCVLGQPESFESESDPRHGGPVGSRSAFETYAAEEKSACSMPCVHKFPSASPSVVDLCSSDDDDELCLQNGRKRKLPLSEVSNNREEDGGGSSKYRLKEHKILSPESMNHISPSVVSSGIRTHMESLSPSKKTIAPLKQCEQKVGVSLDGKNLVTNDIHGEFENAKKSWDYEADLLDDLQKNTELCMKGLCALDGQKKFYGIYVLRATTLAKFLTDGNAKGGLKKTLTDLEQFDPKGADDCKRIALAYYKQLFDIYKNGKDPFFAP